MLAYLGDTDDFTYTETPPPAARARSTASCSTPSQGYCQQYSGAMALLLRMAGIPARVATGFSTGATDTKTGEYVVRDFDAHSWVEVYYPGYGWVTFDPTPAASPARSQPADAAGIAGAPRRLGAAARSRRPALRARRRHPGRGGVAPVVALPALVARRAAGAARRGRRSAVRRWRRGAPPALSELERALQAHPPRARRPGTTLHALERSFARTRPPPPATCAPCARAATATARPARPARSAAACGPSSAAAAASPGRLRAWWALPPR